MVVDEVLREMVKSAVNTSCEGNDLVNNFKGEQDNANLTMMEANAENYEQTLQVESNNLDVMEAVADLYDLVAGMTEQVAELKETLEGGKE